MNRGARAMFMKFLSLGAICFMILSTLGWQSGAVAESMDDWEQEHGGPEPEEPEDLYDPSTGTVDIENLPEQYKQDKGLVLFRSASTWVMEENTTENITVSWMVINADINNRTAENVVLVDNFNESVTVSNTTPLPSVKDNKYVWNLGDIEPFGTINITLELQVTMSEGMDEVPLDAGAVLFSTKDSEPVFNDFTKMSEYSEDMRDYLESTVDANFTDPEIRAVGAVISGDLYAIFEFVQDKIGYESYVGSLRGARGTYWSMAGNSYDQANLLVALLRGAGIPCRYVQGELKTEKAQELILSMFPEDIGCVIGYIPEGEELSDPANDAELLSESRDHMWVQFYAGKDVWVDLDPSFANAKVGESFTEADNIYVETPDKMRHKVTIKVVYEKWDSYWYYELIEGSKGLHTSLSQEFITAGLVGRNVYLRVEAQGEYSDRVPYFGYLSWSNIYKPILMVEDETSRKEFTGSPIKEKFYFKHMIGDLTAFDYEITGSWLKIELDAPGQKTEEYERVIFDKIGYIDRHYRWDESDRSDPPRNRSLQLEANMFQMLFAPSIVPYDFFYNVRYDFYDSFNKFISLQDEHKQDLISTVELAPKAIEIIKKLLFFETVAFGYNSDYELNAYADANLVKYYQKTPRIFIADFKSTSNQFRTRFDLCKNDGYVISYVGTPVITEYYFRTDKGFSDLRLEEDVPDSIFKNDTQVTANKIIREAIKQGIPVQTISINNISELENYNIPGEAKIRIKKQLINEDINIILPETSVIINGTSCYGWIVINTNTGEIIGYLSDGTHGQLIKAMIKIAIQLILIAALMIFTPIGMKILIGIIVLAVAELRFKINELSWEMSHGSRIGFDQIEKYKEIYGDSDPVRNPYSEPGEPPSFKKEVLEVAKWMKENPGEIGRFTERWKRDIADGAILLVDNLLETGMGLWEMVNTPEEKLLQQSICKDLRMKRFYTERFDDYADQAVKYFKEGDMPKFRVAQDLAKANLNKASYHRKLAEETASKWPVPPSGAQKMTNFIRALKVLGKFVTWLDILCEFFEAAAHPEESYFLKDYFKREDPPVPEYLFSTTPYEPELGPSILQNITNVLKDETGSDIQGSMKTSFTTIVGEMNNKWTGYDSTAYSFASATIPSGTEVYDSDWNLIGTGSIVATSSNGQAVVSGEVDYELEGTGKLNFYSPSSEGVSAGGFFDSYISSLSGNDVTIELRNAEVQIDNEDPLPSGNYYIITDSATLKGSGAFVAPVFIDDTLHIRTTNVDINIGDADGEALVGTDDIDVSEGMTIKDFVGTIDLSEHNSTSDGIVLDGIGKALWVELLPKQLIAYLDEDFTLDLEIHSPIDDDYNITVQVPNEFDGSARYDWGVNVFDDGTIDVTVPRGTSAGTYSIFVKVQSESVPELKASAEMEVVVPEVRCMEFEVVEDHMVYVVWNGIVLETAWLVNITNCGNVDDTFKVSTIGHPWLEQSLSEIFVPAGQMVFAGFYVIPPEDATLPTDLQNIEVTVTSTTDSSLTDTQDLPFYFPKADFSLEVGSGPIYSSDGKVATYEIDVSNFGDQEDTVTISVDEIPNSWLSGDTSITIPVGETRTATISISPFDGSLDPKEHEITFRGSSSFLNGFSNTTKSTFDMSVFYGINITLSRSCLYIKPDDTRVVLLTITSMSNVDDNYEIEVDISGTNLLTASYPSKCSVNKRDSIIKIIEIKSSIFALIGTDHEMTVTVTSESEPTISSTVELIVKVVANIPIEDLEKLEYLKLLDVLLNKISSLQDKASELKQPLIADEIWKLYTAVEELYIKIEKDVFTLEPEQNIIADQIVNLMTQLIATFPSIPDLYPELENNMNTIADELHGAAFEDLLPTLNQLNDNLTVIHDILLQIADYGISLELFPRATIAFPESTTNYKITLTNLVESSNVVDLEVLDIDKDWEVEPRTLTVTLNSLETRKISLKITIFEDTSQGVRSFKVRAKPELELSFQEIEAKVIVLVKIGASEVNQIKMEKAVSTGIQWLKDNQGWSGFWRNSGGTPSVGITALACWAMLENGVPLSDPSLKMGLQFIMDCVRNDGLITHDSPLLYDSALALIALSEAGPEYREQVKITLETLVNAQVDEDKSDIFRKIDPNYWYYGGWRYWWYSTDADMSVMGWVLMALAAAGLSLDDPTWEKSQVLMRKWQNKDTGGYGYMGSGNSYTMTPSGLLGLMLSGLNSTDENVAAGLGWLFDHEKEYYSEKLFEYKYYGMLYATRCYHAAQVGSDFYDKVTQLLLDTQNLDGSWLGKRNEHTEMATAESLIILAFNLGSYTGASAFRAVDIEVQPKDLNVPAGITGTYDVLLKNKGGEDTLHLRAEGVPQSWISFEQDEVFLPRKGQESVKLHITPSVTAELKTYPIVVYEQSVSEPGAINADLLNLTVMDPKGVKIDVSPLSQTTGAGHPSYYDITLTNKGMIKDTYLISIESLQDSYGNVQKLSTSYNWFDQIFDYRLPMRVEIGSEEQLDALVEHGINFTLEAIEAGMYGTLNLNNFVLVEYDEAGRVLWETSLGLILDEGFNPQSNAKISLEWIINGTSSPHTQRDYYIYFNLDDISFFDPDDNSVPDDLLIGRDKHTYHEPEFPKATDTVTVTTKRLSENGILYYSYDGLTWQDTPIEGKMTRSGEDLNLRGYKTLYWFLTQGGHPDNHEEFIQFFDSSNNGIKLIGEGTTSHVESYKNLVGKRRYDNYYYALEFEGYILAPETGVYQFASDSNDASEIMINNKVVVGWYGGHGPSNDWSHSGSIYLTKGVHHFLYRYENDGFGYGIGKAGWKTPSGSWELIPSSAFVKSDFKGQIPGPGTTKNVYYYVESVFGDMVTPVLTYIADSNAPVIQVPKLPKYAGVDEDIKIDMMIEEEFGLASKQLHYSYKDSGDYTKALEEIPESEWDDYAKTYPVSIGSPHPYPENTDAYWTVVQGGATAIRAHFTFSQTELDYDYIHIYDSMDCRHHYYTQVRYGLALGILWIPHRLL
jgi:transglutaminase-like putative cysteine protease/uncharacterized membrane protein